MKKNKLVAPLVLPVVKWVGGKRQLLPDIKKYIPKKISKYYEPFIGGGAVFFHLLPKEAVINDINSELINMYSVIRDNLDDLVEDLKTHKNKNKAEYFYKLRELDRDKDITGREARLMAKFDHESNLPKIFTNNGLSILPITRGSYIISHFNAYHIIETNFEKIHNFSLPEHIQSNN